MNSSTQNPRIVFQADPTPPLKIDPIWMERVVRTYPACVWLNPVPETEWDYTQSIRMMRQLLGGRMYPLTLEGLDRAMRELVR